MMGVDPKGAVEALEALGVDVIGANCGSGPEEIDDVMTQMAAERPAGVML